MYNKCIQRYIFTVLFLQMCSYEKLTSCIQVLVSQKFIYCKNQVISYSHTHYCSLFCTLFLFQKDLSVKFHSRAIFLVNHCYFMSNCFFFFFNLKLQVRHVSTTFHPSDNIFWFPVDNVCFPFTCPPLNVKIQGKLLMRQIFISQICPIKQNGGNTITRICPIKNKIIEITRNRNSLLIKSA